MENKVNQIDATNSVNATDSRDSRSFSSTSQRLAIETNIRNACLSLSAVLVTGAVLVLRYLITHRTIYQNQLKELAQQSYTMGLLQGTQSGYEQGVNHGFLLGQEHVITQIQTQPPPQPPQSDRWKNN